jgi:hypothetical protein
VTEKTAPITPPAYNERVIFRLIMTPCCGHMLCWVNPRFPECGTHQVRRCVVMRDSEQENPAP